jgi:hypothetical protein
MVKSIRVRLRREYLTVRWHLGTAASTSARLLSPRDFFCLLLIGRPLAPSLDYRLA